MEEGNIKKRVLNLNPRLFFCDFKKINGYNDEIKPYSDTG